MADHNFLTDTYDSNTAILDECKAHIAEIVLPSEPASQFEGEDFLVKAVIEAIINGTLLEVAQVFEGQSYMYRFAKKGISNIDANYSLKFDAACESIQTFKTVVTQMTTTMNVSCDNGITFLDRDDGQNLAQTLTISTIELSKQLVHGKEYLELNGIDDCLSYDENENRYIVNKTKVIDGLLQKDSLSESEKKKLLSILILSVDDKGEIDTDFLGLFLESCYSKEYRISNVKSNPAYASIAYTYDYSAVFHRNDNLELLLGYLQTSKYNTIKIISSKCAKTYESVSFSKRTLLNSWKRTDEEVEKELLSCSRYETETAGTNAIGRLIFDISHTDYTNSINGDHYCGYSLEIRNGTIHNNNENHLDIFEHTFYNSTIYVNISSIDTGTQIIKNEFWALMKGEHKDLLREFNEFRQDEEFDINSVISNTFVDVIGGEICGKLAGKVEILGSTAWSFANALKGELDRVNEAKKTNTTISELQSKYGDRWNSIIMCVANQKRAELMLKGINPERIEVLYNKNGIIEDIIFAEPQTVPFDFRKKYEDFYQECKKTSGSDLTEAREDNIPSYDEIITLDETGNDITTFDSLSPELRSKMIEWCSFMSTNDTFYSP